MESMEKDNTKIFNTTENYNKYEMQTKVFIKFAKNI